MPIVALEDDHIDQQCALCGDVHRVVHTQLKAGDDPNVIALPPCPNCGAFEFLIRSGEEAAKTSDPMSHRALVEQLHARLMRDKPLTGVLSPSEPRAEA